MDFSVRDTFSLIWYHFTIIRAMAPLSQGFGGSNAFIKYSYMHVEKCDADENESEADTSVRHRETYTVISKSIVAVTSPQRVSPCSVLQV